MPRKTPPGLSYNRASDLDQELSITFYGLLLLLTKRTGNASSVYRDFGQMWSPVNLLVAVSKQLSKCLEETQQTVVSIMPDNRANVLKLWNMAIFHTPPTVSAPLLSKRLRNTFIDGIKGWNHVHRISSFSLFVSLF